MARKLKRMKMMLPETVERATLLFIAFFLLLLLPISLLFGQEKPAASQATQLSYSTPKEAADAFIQAAQTFDVPALEKILGPHSEDLLESEDQVQAKNNAVAFGTKGQQKTEVTVDPRNPQRATMTVGEDDWPSPIPLVQKNGRWMFDTKAGRQEILYRRIGSNELDAIAICRGYVEAQQEYALQKHDNSEVNQYAQRVISTPGKHDGLAWRETDGTLGGPIAESIADALQQGYTDKTYHGYYFKILKGQGPDVPLGQLSYLVRGAMIGGFAMAAAPSDYRVSGVKTFLVNQDGVVYQKDLGPDTLKVFREMELYNPDKTWTPTDDNW